MAHVTTSDDSALQVDILKAEIKEYLSVWLQSPCDIHQFEGIYAEVLEDLLVELVAEAKEVESIRQRVLKARTVS